MVLMLMCTKYSKDLANKVTYTAEEADKGVTVKFHVIKCHDQSVV